MKEMMKYERTSLFSLKLLYHDQLRHITSWFRRIKLLLKV